MDFNGTNNMNRPYQVPRQMNNNHYNNRGSFAPRSNDAGFVDGVPSSGLNGNITPNGSAPYNSYNRRNNSGYSNGYRSTYNGNYNSGSSNYTEDWSKPMAADERLEA